MIRLSNVDFPAFGRPINEAYPVFIWGSDLDFLVFGGSDYILVHLTIPSRRGAKTRKSRSDPLDLRFGRQTHADLMNATALGFKNLNLQSIDFEGLADGRHAADPREDIAADGLESLRLDATSIDDTLANAADEAILRLEDPLRLPDRWSSLRM